MSDEIRCAVMDCGKEAECEVQRKEASLWLCFPHYHIFSKSWNIPVSVDSRSALLREIREKVKWQRKRNTGIGKPYRVYRDGWNMAVETFLFLLSEMEGK